MAKETFQGLWIGEGLSPYERMCITSFLDHGHDFHLYAYDQLDNVPAGTTVMDAREILPESDIFTYRHGEGKGSVAVFSDWFRYKLLFDRGGWWVDLDVVCLGNELPDTEIVLAPEDHRLVNCAIMRFPAGSAFMHHALVAARAMGRDVLYSDPGPQLITRLVEHYGLGGELQPLRRLYPVHWKAFIDVLIPAKRPEIDAALEGACFLHLWNEMYRRTGLRKDVRPPKGSYLYHLFEQTGLLGAFDRGYRLHSGFNPLARGALLRMRRAVSKPFEGPERHTLEWKTFLKSLEIEGVTETRR